MITAVPNIKKEVKAFCTLIGADPLLVQGAGGNISWKDGSIMWIKASGTWLAEAETKEIFVPVNFRNLQDALVKQDFSIKSEIVDSSGLRPSIETLLHALMPHKIVVHLHAVEILAHLVRINAKQKIKDLVGDKVKWIFIDYFKPGPELARAVFEELNTRPDADVVFMSNHGVVIGGANLDDVSELLNRLIFKLKNKISPLRPESSPAVRKLELLKGGYIPCSDKEVNLLAFNNDLISRLDNEWALYPDHIVFLGAEASILRRNFTPPELDEKVHCKPPFIIAIGDGVYESFTTTPAQKKQLRCYFDVVVRQGENQKLCTLNKREISELICWEAEKYRLSM